MKSLLISFAIHTRLMLLPALLLLASCHLATEQRSDLKKRHTHYTNPVIPGFNPDPSIIRVEDDFYLVTSTFEYFPGVPIYHSKNLVNWKLIGHALHRQSQLDLSGIKSTAGIFAPTIRHNNGTFYVITTLVAPDRVDKPAGNFVVTAKHPTGPWSDPHWIEDAPGIDPDLFFDDDGKAYYTGNRHPKVKVDKHHREIWTQEIDLDTFQLKGPIWTLDSKPYFESQALGSVVAFEGPHLYKKNGIYYMLVSHGGTGMGHAVSIWKSRRIGDPWEINPSNPILTHRGYARSGINATGHADLVQTQHGDWWTVFLGVRSWDKKNNAMGRETFLAPVDWSGTWPIVNPNGQVGRTAWQHQAPTLAPIEKQQHDFYDDFSGDQLNLAWTYIRTPSSRWWHLDKTAKTLKITPQTQKIAQYSQPSFAGIRVHSRRIESATELTFNPKVSGDKAGLAILRGHDPFWTLVKEKVNDKLVVSAYNKDTLIAKRALAGNGPLKLSIVLADFKLFFSFKENGKPWVEFAGADASTLGFPPAGRFTGAFAGPYATTEQASNDKHHTADFHWFSLKRLPLGMTSK